MTPKFSSELVVETDDPSDQHERLQSPRFGLNSSTACVATIVGFDQDGSVLVDFPANPFLKVLNARSCIDLSANDVGREVVLWFEGGDLARPLVMGSLRSPACAKPKDHQMRIDADQVVASPLSDEVRVIAARSVTLQCGKASITLTREGRILLNGVYVETRASGTNRIQGGSVRIN